MSKPYTWIDEHDTPTRSEVMGGRKEKKRTAKEILDDLTEESEALGLYEDSIEYKCTECGRALPCRQHRRKDQT